MIIEHSKNEKLQKHRIILSGYLLFTQMMDPFKFFHVSAAKVIFFGNIPNYV